MGWLNRTLCYVHVWLMGSYENGLALNDLLLQLVNMSLLLLAKVIKVYLHGKCNDFVVHGSTCSWGFMGWHNTTLRDLAYIRTMTRRRFSRL